ncbi:MAG: AgmX/PglI C-terminal domain-containing protein [Labilithrix sp.]|nr:AgmX/PglI C-terminal domain-containing protein [Labilithrix sp.]
MRTPLFRLGFAMFTSVMVVAAVACGGKEGAGASSPTSSGAAGGADTPSGSGGAGGAGGEASGGEGAGSGGEAAGSGGGTTTTTQLGDGGDLQGAKLGGSVHTTTETKGEGGPKSTRGQSANEAGRTTKDIQAIVVARRDEARACYDKGLAAHPGIEGDLDIKWVIDPQGNVTDASVDTTKSQILEPGVGACVVEVIKKIKFAESKGGYETRAHYPFNFHPKASTAKDAGK